MHTFMKDKILFLVIHTENNTQTMEFTLKINTALIMDKLRQGK